MKSTDNADLMALLPNTREFLKELNAGCSAFMRETEDGKHLWGRNFDFNRIAQISQVT